MKNFKMNVQSKLLSKLATTCLLTTAGLLVITASWLTFIGCAPVMEPVSNKAGDGGPPTPPALVGPIYIAVGDGGKIALSKDSGVSWAAVDSGITGNLNDIATDGTNIVVVADNGGLVKSTDGGESWTVIASTGISTTTAAEIEYGNGVFVFMTYKSSAPHYAFYRSTNSGATWATGTIASGLFPANDTRIHFAYDGSRFLAVSGGGDRGTIAVSADGLDYTSGHGNGGDIKFESNWLALSIANGRFFIFNRFVGSFTTPNIYQSPTGTWGDSSPWTTNRSISATDTTTFPAGASGMWIGDVAHSGSVYAFVDTFRGIIMTSATAMDGSFTLPTSPVSSGLNRIIFFKDKFVAAGRSGKIVNGDAAGTTWTEVTSGTTEHLLVGEATANTIVFVGADGKIIVSSDGTTWEEKSATGNDTEYKRLLLIE